VVHQGDRFERNPSALLASVERVGARRAAGD
jgi:hypothetical protein